MPLPKTVSKTRKPILFMVCLLFAFCGIHLYWSNTTFGVTRYTIADESLPPALQGFTIVQISDLHNTAFGKQQSQLLEATAQQQPDIIAITGDFIDSYHTDISISMEFIHRAAAIAPIYYVPGNHESRLPEQYARLKQQLKAAGVILLEDAGAIITYNHTPIRLLGVKDPSFTAPENAAAADTLKQMSQTLDSLLTRTAANADSYTILLSHRPELLDAYRTAGIPLVLSGHTHGGQIRLPGIGALYAPNQGLFPAYAAGLYNVPPTRLIISRGLGNSIIPVRIGNRPELVSITLQPTP